MATVFIRLEECLPKMKDIPWASKYLIIPAELRNDVKLAKVVALLVTGANKANKVYSSKPEIAIVNKTRKEVVILFPEEEFGKKMPIDKFVKAPILEVE